LGVTKTITEASMTYKKGELVEVREYSVNRTNNNNNSSVWIENWLPAVVVKWHGMTKMRTGIARFENLEVVSVLLNGKIRKFPTRSIRHLRE
jgi:hypothetical protein